MKVCGRIENTRGMFCIDMCERSGRSERSGTNRVSGGGNGEAIGNMARTRPCLSAFVI
jgi:hypothetical protein